MATAVEPNNFDGDVSPRHKSSMEQAIQSLDGANNPLGSLNLRADPDAQATVTDYLDFTEYLPADMMRSLTLIGKLDQTYVDASLNVHELTTTWGKLLTLPADQRPVPAQLRADISENLNRALSSRTSSYAEACRMSDYVNRHVNRAKTILSKLQTMRGNYPTEEQKSPVQTKSPQLSRAPKITLRLEKDGQKVRRLPRITVPGEVLAPYELEFNAYSSASDDSSDEEVSLSPPRQTTTPAPRIKLVKTPKVPKQKLLKPPRPPRPTLIDPAGVPLSTSTALAQLKPPPENAAPGSPDAPWLQLTQYELAKLRKRMKKNAVWSPSDTMIARELKQLGRGIEAYRAAQKKAEDEGKPFEGTAPAPVAEGDSGTQHPPEGAISAEALGAEEVQLSNRGMKLNEAKKLKREQMAKQAVEEAEESARRMAEAARLFLNHEASPSVAGSVPEKPIETGPSSSQASSQAQSQPQLQPQPQPQPPAQPPVHTQAPAKAPSKSKTKKRKRESVSEAGPPPEIKSEATEGPTPAPPPSLPLKPQPQVKRAKTETPILPPQLTSRPTSVPPPVETPIPLPHVGQTAPVRKPSNTPVPVPVQPSSETTSTAMKPTTSSPAQGTSPAPPTAPPAAATTTTTVPTKPPAETHVPPPAKTSSAPVLSAKTSTTPIPPPAQPLPKRENRKDVQKNPQPITINTRQSSRANTPAPVTTPLEATPASARRPVSRGNAGSQEPPATHAVERPRRASTARNTPAPEPRQPSKRNKRPAPGVVTTNPGGTSAVGKRKAAPRKRPKTGKKGITSQQQPEQEVEVEVDDDGNVIDPDEPKYCLCNRVSFGTMIQCDNDVSRNQNNINHKKKCRKMNSKNKKLTTGSTQNCKQEWFHLECVGLSEIPARTTKWYCPDCRVLLNIGRRGEVNSRGIKL